MSRWSRRAVLASAAAVLAFGGVTLLALEGAEVAVLATVDARGATRTTRVWLADDGTDAWIEAATPDRPFLGDIRANPQVTLERAGSGQSCRADVVPNPEGHAHIRRLLRARYGWADRWIGLLTDTSGSVAIRLRCA